MKKIIWVIMVLLALAPFTVAQAKTYNVSVSQFVEHGMNLSLNDNHVTF